MRWREGAEVENGRRGEDGLHPPQVAAVGNNKGIFAPDVGIFRGYVAAPTLSALCVCLCRVLCTPNILTIRTHTSPRIFAVFGLPKVIYTYTNINVWPSSEKRHAEPLPLFDRGSK